MKRFERVMLTGSAGFIGSHVADSLLSQGHLVLGIDDFNDYYAPAMKRQNIAHHMENMAYTLAEGDIRDKGWIKKMMLEWKPTVIIHLAARAGVRPSLEQADLFAATNIVGTLNILEAAKHSCIKKLIFASSSSVYGLNEKVPFGETDSLLRPASPYAATKIAGEALCHTYAHLYHIPTVALRFFTVYGPRQRPDLAIRKFFEKIGRGEPIVLYGDGSSSRDYTYVDDIVQGVMAAMNYEVEKYEVFNLGNSAPISLIRLVRAIEEVVGRKANIIHQGDQPGDVPITYADISKAQDLLGYNPATPLEAGLVKMYQHLWTNSFQSEEATWPESSLLQGIASR